MRITAELSLYPLRDDYVPAVQSFIHIVQDMPGLRVRVNQMSTQLTGELGDVCRAVETALQRSFESGGPQALVVKFLNADLPLDEPPDLGA
ncbi:MAG: YkoF family thiamine/hydroxymethylpyrimidine-binding protein [Rhodospirillaceae bacterium]|nr:YkoF family thiamine/hydroxymethylpyrimidine-binding protein [Rhodospirillaceae bacterium]MDD9999547.1 YkoF family thiamine/hydroxymethylpyrimidine-binding protein [Rhodospirillaceae bacterium]MDE0363225.1 YkoF family thiamine/hydroxymethylpyrimidine-binding protein [Rhodospirillaceae bacterium]